MPPRFLGLNAHLRLIHPDHETIGMRLCNVQGGFPHPTTRIEYQRWKTAFRPLVSQFIKGKLVVQSDRFWNGCRACRATILLKSAWMLDCSVWMLLGAVVRLIGSVVFMA